MAKNARIYRLEPAGLLQDSVANVLLEDDREARGERRMDKDPRKIIEEARERGLI